MTTACFWTSQIAKFEQRKEFYSYFLEKKKGRTTMHRAGNTKIVSTKISLVMLEGA